MRWKFAAIAGSVLAALVYIAVPQSASALPSAARGDVVKSDSANSVQQVRRRYWRGRRSYGYRPYRYRRYGYYDPYYYGGGYPYYYRRRPGFGIYLGF
jgi:hypothetical protein